MSIKDISPSILHELVAERDALKAQLETALKERDEARAAMLEAQHERDQYRLQIDAEKIRYNSTTPEPSRLEIAARIMQGMLSCGGWDATRVAHVALDYADKLIAAAKEVQP